MRKIASRVIRKLKANLPSINFVRNALEDRWLRIRHLQAANAYQLHVIRSLRNELNAKRTENAVYVRQFKSRTVQGLAVPEASPTAGTSQSASDRSTLSHALNSVLAANVAGPLAKLGERNIDLDGVVCLERDLGTFATGDSDLFLNQVAAHRSGFQRRSYIQSLYEAELNKLGIIPSGIAVDFHPASNNTIAPLLADYPELSVVAVGAEPFQLAALLRAAREHGVAHRCAAIASAADCDLFTGELANFVFGGTILHRLVHPKLLLKTAIEVLRPGGHGIFFGPFENGHAILRLAYGEILREAKARGLAGRGFDFLQSMAVDIASRCQRENYPGLSMRWFDLEDKWLFSKSDLEQYCFECGATSVHIRSFNHPTSPFMAQTRGALENYGGMAASDALPDWAWNTLRRYDDEAFSPELLHDLIIEGAIVITK